MLLTILTGYTPSSNRLILPPREPYSSNLYQPYAGQHGANQFGQLGSFFVSQNNLNP